MTELASEFLCIHVLDVADTIRRGCPAQGRAWRTRGSRPGWKAGR